MYPVSFAFPLCLSQTEGILAYTIVNSNISSEDTDAWPFTICFIAEIEKFPSNEIAQFSPGSVSCVGVWFCVCFF